jgi:hypothetical protein
MEVKLTAVFQKVSEGYIGFVQELPGANTRGATLMKRARTSLRLSSWCWRPIGCFPKSLYKDKR